MDIGKEIKMEKIKPWLRVVGFFAGLFVVLSVCDFLFAQTGYVRFILHEQKKGGYDTIIVGTSHCRGGINPERLDEKNGTNSLNMAIPGETVQDSYFIIKDAAKNNDIKTVIFDIDYQYWFYEQPTTHFTRPFIYEQFTDPGIKFEYLLRNWDVLDMRNFLANRLTWDYKLSTVKRNIAMKTSDAYKNYDIESAYSEDGVVEGADGPYVGKGFFERRGTEPGKLPPGADYVATWIDRYDDAIDENVKDIFRELVKFCKENDIELICVTSPITPTVVKTLGMDTVHDTMSAFLVDECGLEYYDFNKALMSSVPRDDCNYGDQEGHMGGELAEIYSTALGNLLKDRTSGKVDESKYFYSTFEDMFNNMRSDYEKVTGNKWEGL